MKGEEKEERSREKKEKEVGQEGEEEVFDDILISGSPIVGSPDEDGTKSK